MNRGLIDLILLSVRGRVVRRFRLLRQPRYLVATLAGVCYFAFVLNRRYVAGGGGRRAAPMIPGGLYGDIARLAPGLGLAIVLTCLWLLVSAKPALRLNETELDFLLPAPLPRRQIVFYSLLRQQPALLTTTLVVFFFGGAAWWGGRTLPGLFAFWAFFTLADLHIKGISLWKARLREVPAPAAVWRRIVAVTLGAVWWTALLAALTAAWRAVAAAVSLRTDPGAFVRALARAVEAGPARVLLVPFVWLTAPLSETVVPAAAGALLLLGALALHVAWVMRSRASFEEATLERARRESARKGVSRQELRARRARHKEAFRLAPLGSPEAAIVWKNLMLRGRTPLRASATVLAGLILAGGLAAALWPIPVATVLTVVGLALLCGIPLFSGLMLRNDLRTDLLHAEILRTWPLPGRRLVLAEVLAPAANAFVLMLLGCGLALAGAFGDAVHGGKASIVLLPRSIAGTQPFLAILVLLGSLLLAGAAVAVLSLALQNLAVLVLPSWIGLGLAPRRGTAILGQRLLVGIGHLLAMTLAALPTLLVVGAVVALHIFLQAPFRLWEVPALAGVAALLLGTKALLLVRLAGTVWDRMDPSQEILAEGEG